MVSLPLGNGFSILPPSSLHDEITDKSAIKIGVSNLIDHNGLIKPIILICIKSHFNIDNMPVKFYCKDFSPMDLSIRHW